jgi:hypothetical protein
MTKKADIKKTATKKAPAKKAEAKKTIPELLDELHARFTAKLGESYRARDCAKKVNKIKRLVGADEVLKG